MTGREGTNPPDPRACVQESDVGKLHHDSFDDVWYECMFDRSGREYTWVILPPAD
jgi:hypothetical protein